MVHVAAEPGLLCPPLVPLLTLAPRWRSQIYSWWLHLVRFWFLFQTLDFFGHCLFISRLNVPPSDSFGLSVFILFCTRLSGPHSGLWSFLFQPSLLWKWHITYPLVFGCISRFYPDIIQRCSRHSWYPPKASQSSSTSSLCVFPSFCVIWCY